MEDLKETSALLEEPDDLKERKRQILIWSLLIVFVGIPIWYIIGKILSSIIDISISNEVISFLFNTFFGILITFIVYLLYFLLWLVFT